MDFTIQVQKIKKLDTLTSHVIFETEIFELFIILLNICLSHKSYPLHITSLYLIIFNNFVVSEGLEP